MLLELLGAALLLGSVGEKKTPTHRQSNKRDFEEYESYIDRHGKEHVIDEEGYCEECDDYHDDY